MNHQDAEITEVVIVIAANYRDGLSGAVEKLKVCGVEILSTDEEDCVVNGSIETYKIPVLEKLECVNYVRSVMTYIADFPVGDPRDTDLTEDEDDAEAV